ncbi:MAG TPA: AI-2E family transporter, partial [Roseiflexaceae bacterium]|nr:AI-2E family transporter [Roseiflexaceae bacterium]
MALKLSPAPSPSSVDAAVLIATLLSGGAIYLLRDIIAPLVLALFLLVVVSEFSRRIHALVPKAPRNLTLGLSLVIIVAAFAIICWIIVDNLTGILGDAKGYVERLDRVLLTIGHRLGLELPPNIASLLESIEPSRAASVTLEWLQGGVSASVFVLIYLGFLMASRRSFARKLAALSTDGEGVSETKDVFERIGRAVESYIWVQTTTGLMIAGASWLLMLAVGLPQPLFWAFVIFVANYVPIVGGALGILAPALFGLLVFDDLTRPILLLAGLQTIGFVVGNVIQPRMQSLSLNIDPVIVLLSLAFWGALLGATGAFLST